MAEETSDPWREIISDAIRENSSEPMIGTHFRGNVDSAASKRGLRFPPAEQPQLRFIELLERYPDIVSVLRRPGQDFLVVPSGRSDLLSQGIQDRLYGVRRDIFEAFTIISADRPFYDKNTDQIVWRKAEETVTDSLVPIQPPSETAEVQLRREFAQGVPEQSSVLLAALNDPRPLQAFSRAIKSSGLQRRWHSFRTERLVQKIQKWARDNKIDWNNSWLTDRPPDLPRRAPLVSTGTAARPERDPLQVLMSGLDAADIQRISVPLDLVLKAIAASKRR